MTKKSTLGHSGLVQLSLFALYVISMLFANNTNAQTLPRPDHIIILIEENQPNALVMGAPSVAPYINQLAADSDAVTFTNFYALEHPSQPNYLDLFAGNNQGVLDDNLPANYPFTSPNMAYELIHKGYSFITYSQDLPSEGSDAQNSTTGSYVRKHNPVANWIGTGQNQVSDTCNEMYSQFPTDYSKLPTVCYVVPNEDSDMHNGTYPSTCTEGDYWMHEHLDSLFKWVRDNNALFIYTFDEDDGFYSNKIPTLFYGPMVKGGTCSTRYDLYSLLRTVEDMYSLGEHAGSAASASDITDVWRSAPTGINSINTASSLIISPNPASATLTLDASKMNVSACDIAIYDVTGRILGHYTMPESKKLSINTSEYMEGLYFYHFDAGKSEVQTGKFIVSHQ